MWYGYVNRIKVREFTDEQSAIDWCKDPNTDEFRTYMWCPFRFE